MHSAIQRISFLGTGRLAHAFATELSVAGFVIHQVWSRTPAHAQTFAAKFGGTYIPGPHAFDPSNDLLILAISDDSLDEVNAMPIPRNLPVVHTSGSKSLDVLDGFPQRGVLYPLQSFSFQKKVDFKQTPAFIEANSPAFSDSLVQLAESLFGEVYLIDSEQRAYLHLSAVWVNNFSNHLFTMAQELMATQQLDFNWLLPIIRETVAKLEILKPNEAQTGPALREDASILQKHLQMLRELPDSQEIYRLMSQHIQKTHSKNS